MSENEKPGYVSDSLTSLKSIGDAAHKAGDSLQGVGADAISQARETLHDAQGRAADLGSEIAKQAASIADSQKSGVAHRLESVASTFHRSSEELREEEEWLAQLIDKGAGEMTKLAGTLRANDFKNLLEDLQSLARRQPALFMGTSVVAGFALARIGKSAAMGASTELTSDPAEATK